MLKTNYIFMHISKPNGILMEEPIQPIEQTLTACPECDAEVVPGKVFCSKCGFPVNGSKEQKIEYNIKKHYLNNQLEAAEDSIKVSRLMLYAMAALMFIGGFVISFIYPDEGDGSNSGFVFFITLIIAGIYAGLGFWARKRAFAALLTGLILAIIFFTFQIIGAESKEDFIGIYIYILAVIFLIKGTKSSYDAENIKKQLHVNK
jgi:hypothetical protein